MSRRRYISSDISFDSRVNRLAVQAGDFAVMLYTWMIPHADDDGSLPSDSEEILYRVIPGRRDKSSEDVQQALNAMRELGLIEIDETAKRLYFPPESFYRYQTYIPEVKRRKAPEPQANSEKRRRSARISADQRETTNNAASPSPSPSPSEDLKDYSSAPVEPDADQPRQHAVSYQPEHLALAEQLRDRILQNKPDAKTPQDLSAWANTMRLIVTRDGRKPQRIAEVIDWCQQDEFWRVNILSADKLRKQFDRLEMQMSTQRARASPLPRDRPLSAAAIYGSLDDEVERISQLKGW